MRKITFLLSALLVTSVLVAETSITPLWTSTGYSWNTGNRSRDIAIYDGKIYVTDNNAAASAVHVIDASTGNENADATIANANFQSFGIAVDNAGHLLLPNNTGGASSWILSKVDIASGIVTTLNAGTAISSYRTDFIEVNGNIESTDQPAYIIGASTNNPQIQAWEAKSGDLTATAPFIWARPAASVGADIKWIDNTHILLTQQSTTQTPNPLIFTLDFSTPDAYITETKVVNIPSTSYGGGAYFVLEGKPYIVLPTGTSAAYGSIGIFDISDIETPVAVGGEPTPAIGATGNATAHLGIEVVTTAANKATIYVWSPNNGAAAYEFTVTTSDIKEIAKSDIVVKSTTEGIEIGLDATSTIELYTVSGLLIDKTIATGTYSHALSSGIYVIRVNGQVVKFIK